MRIGYAIDLHALYRFDKTRPRPGTLAYSALSGGATGITAVLVRLAPVSRNKGVTADVDSLDNGAVDGLDNGAWRGVDRLNNGGREVVTGGGIGAPRKGRRRFKIGRFAVN